jgi:hypothetical protein
VQTRRILFMLALFLATFSNSWSKDFLSPDVLSYFGGAWSGTGHFATGKPIASESSFTPRPAKSMSRRPGKRKAAEHLSISDSGPCIRCRGAR